MRFGFYMLCYWSAYIIVTILGAAQVAFNWKVRGMETDLEDARALKEAPSVAKTIPFMPLYSLLIWPLFAFFYLQRLGAAAHPWRVALVLAAGWMLLTIILDLVGWVLVRPPWREIYEELYATFRRWIILNYLAIFLSPLLAVFFLL